MAEDLRAEHGQRHAEHREARSPRCRDAARRASARAGASSTRRSPSTSRPACRWRASGPAKPRVGLRRANDCRRRRARSFGAVRRSRRVAHAASSAVICDSTISRYVGHVSSSSRVGAEPDRLAVFEHEDLIGVDDRRDSLGDDEDGGVGRVRRRARRAAGRRWRGRAPRTSRRTGRSRACARAPGRSPAAAADRPTRSSRPGRSVASSPPGIARTKSRRLGDLERLPQLVVGGVGLGEAEVAGDRAGEQVRLLRHEPDAAPQRVGVEVADVDTVDQHRARGGVEQAGDQAEQRGLAGTGAADDRGDLTRLGEQRDVGQHRRLGAGVVEADVAQLERAGGRRAR